MADLYQTPRQRAASAAAKRMGSVCPPVIVGNSTKGAINPGKIATAV